MARDLEAELDRHDGQRIPSWEPEPGEKVVGTLLRYESRQTQYGDTQVAVIDREDGRGLLGIWTSAVMLRNAFDREQPRPGDQIGVKFLGYPEGKRYKSFALVVRRAQPAPPARPYAETVVSRGPAGRGSCGSVPGER